MARSTDQAWLLANFDLLVIQYGPRPGWPAGADIYLRCPRCGDYASMARDDACRCGRLSVDTGYARVTVEGAAENEVAVCRAVPKRQRK